MRLLSKVQTEAIRVKGESRLFINLGLDTRQLKIQFLSSGVLLQVSYAKWPNEFVWKSIGRDFDVKNTLANLTNDQNRHNIDLWWKNRVYNR